MTLQADLDALGKDAPPGMDPGEWDLRVRLAACYRVFDHLGWSELIFNHISARLPGPGRHLLINPFGLLYKEVTASNLVKVDLEGNTIGHSDWPVNRAGIVIHTAIHASRPDAHVVMHTHTTAGSAVAGLEGGVDPNNFYAATLEGQIAYHEFEGITVEPGEQERLVASLGDRSLLVLRNHGLLACGPTIPAAFFRLWTLERACQIQLATSAAGPARQVSEEAKARSGAVMARAMSRPDAGEDLFAALWRQVDATDPSYRS